jgi:NADH:ubiquinone oxidoreductase subunit C
MSDAHHDHAAATERPAIQSGLPVERLREILITRVAAVADPRDLRGTTVIVSAERLRDAVLLLRDEADLRFDQLVDISGVDYLAYPGHRGPRYAVVYLFKSTVFRHRVTLKVEVDEDAAQVPSIHDLFLIADWAERETWDQYGVVFAGHPNLKRLLNHHEFHGHPLRKDYPCQKRQKLSVNDPMIDQLEARLKKRGYTVTEHGAVEPGAPMTYNDQAGAAR